MWCACDYNQFPVGVKELSVAKPDNSLLAFGNQMIMVSCEPCRGRRKAKQLYGLVKNKWQALKALADSLGRTAAQLVREAIDLLLKKYGAK